MKAVEILIESQKFVLRGDESEEHLEEVAELVRRKIASAKKSAPNLNLQKATMLAALDLASEMIKGRKKAYQYRSEILGRTGQLLERVELELSSRLSD